MDTKLSGDQAYHKIEPQLVAELTGKEPKRQKRYTQKGEYVWVLRIEIPSWSDRDVMTFIRSSKESCERKYHEILLAHFYDRLMTLSADEISDRIEESKKKYPVMVESIPDLDTLIRMVHRFEDGRWVVDRTVVITDMNVLETWITEGKWFMSIVETEVE
jgi:hypothetical protein